jgi:hypothetical protein
LLAIALGNTLCDDVCTPHEVGAKCQIVIVAATVPVTLEKFFPEYVRQLERAGFTVWLVCSPTAALDALRAAYPRARVVPIPMKRGISPIGDAAALLRGLH